MKLAYHQRKISGLLTVLPAHERTFMEEMAHFNASEKRCLKLKRIMGYDRHRIVDGPVCVSDLAVTGMRYLFENELLGPNDFQAMILATQSPDHFIPATSNVIQGRLGLSTDLYCLDINQGCTGFLIGLQQAFSLLSQSEIHRVVLINADVLSRKISHKDRNSFPLAGDGLSITIVERDQDASHNSTIHATLRMDGSRHNALMVPAGGLRMPSTPETAVLEDIGDGNYRAKDHLRMDGTGVFNFVQTEVPTMIKELLNTAEKTDADVDYYMFHQPNRFLLQKLADKMGVDRRKMPSNVVEHFGNSSGVTIPVAMAYNLGQQLCDSVFSICLAGFGVGLSWSSMLLNIGRLDFCKMIDHES